MLDHQRAQTGQVLNVTLRLEKLQVEMMLCDLRDQSLIPVDTQEAIKMGRL